MANEAYEIGQIAKVTFEFRVGGDLTDPGSMTAKVRKPSGTLAPDPTIVNSDVGVYNVSWLVTEPGVWVTQAEGTDPARTTLEHSILAKDSAFDRDLWLSPWLTSRREVKVALGVADVETSDDAKIDQAIFYASAAIRMFTGRTFELSDPAAVPSVRTFVYDETGIITTDEFRHGSLVSVGANGVTLQTPSGGWIAEPRPAEYPVAWWIELPPIYPESPQMGFTRNMDVLAREGGLRTVTRTVDISAVWGWPSIPGDVRQAAVWTAIAFKDNPRPYVSESIAGYSRVSVNPMRHAIPERAQELLAPHTKT